MSIVPPPIVHLVAGCDNHVVHIWAEASPPLPRRGTPAPAVRPYQLELWKVASRDWIKKDYIIQEVPCPRGQNSANIVHQYESTDVFEDESLYTVPIQRQALIYNRCRHLCHSLPLSFAAALECHRCEVRMNLHPECHHFDTVACSAGKPGWEVQSGRCCRVCFGTKDAVLCRSREVEIRILSVYIIREEKRMAV